MYSELVILFFKFQSTQIFKGTTIAEDKACWCYFCVIDSKNWVTKSCWESQNLKNRVPQILTNIP